MANYSEELFRKIFLDTIEYLTDGKLKQEKNKIAFLLGGQPGAGKTTLHAIIKESNDNVIIVDNDSFKRLHPDYQELENKLGKEVISAVTPFSNRLTEAIVERLSSDGYNLVIEGTLRTTEVPIKTTQLLKDKGYNVSLYIIATSFEQSYISTIERYEEAFKINPKSARYTPIENQLITVKALPENLKKLVDSHIFKEVVIYNRESERLYSSIENSNIEPHLLLREELQKKEKPLEAIQELDKVIELIKSNHHEDSEPYNELQQRKKVIEMDRRESYIEQLKEYIAEDEYLANGKGTEQSIKDITVQESLDKYAEDHKIDLKQDQEQERGI